jgi:phosphocarrier protein
VIADAKSILSVLTLAAAVGSELEVKVEGEDEEAAADAIERLFLDGFGEN